MKIAARFPLIKQHHAELLAICDPLLVSDIRPKESQKGRYVELLKHIKNHIDAIETDFRKGILNEATIQRDIPRDLLEYYKDKILPSQAAIDKAFETLDPDLAELFHLFDDVLAPSGADGKCKFTFDVAIERMEELVEDNPDLEGSFSVLRANEILDSKLIEFNPDEWLDNAGELYPVRTSRNGAEIPVQAKQRLVEIYRSYIFGNWLSVLALARSALEYTILDNLHKFNISPTYEITTPKHEFKPKKLSHLIEEVGEILPELMSPMEEIRDYGNEYIHPKKSKRSKEALFQKKEKAESCLRHLREVVEGLYWAVGKKA
jgi:hypothetical protein